MRLGASRESDLSPLIAVSAATLVYTIAAERAAVRASGPGSFAVFLLDALAALESVDVVNAARIVIEEQSQ